MPNYIHVQFYWIIDHCIIHWPNWAKQQYINMCMICSWYTQCMLKSAELCNPRHNSNSLIVSFEWWLGSNCGSIIPGAEQMNACFIFSSQSTVPMETVARSTSGLKWMQTYIFRNRNATIHIIKKAESLGFKALVITIDTQKLPFGRRPRPLHVPPGFKMEIFEEAGLLVRQLASYACQPM